MEWRKIETAPRGGEEVIGIFAADLDTKRPVVDGPYTMRFDRGRWKPSWYGESVIESQGDFGTDYHVIGPQPTHWMPLPSPPEKE